MITVQETPKHLFNDAFAPNKMGLSQPKPIFYRFALRLYRKRNKIKWTNESIKTTYRQSHCRARRRDVLLVGIGHILKSGHRVSRQNNTIYESICFNATRSTYQKTDKTKKICINGLTFYRFLIIIKIVQNHGHKGVARI